MNSCKISVVLYVNASQYNKYTASTWNDDFVQTPSADSCATITVPADRTVSNYKQEPVQE